MNIFELPDNRFINVEMIEQINSYPKGERNNARVDILFNSGKETSSIFTEDEDRKTFLRSLLAKLNHVYLG